MTLHHLATNGFLEHLVRVAGGGAGVDVILSGKKTGYRVPSTYIDDSNLKVELSGRVLGKAPVEDLLIASYMDSATIKRPGYLEVEIDERDFQREMAAHLEELEGSPDLEITIQDVDNAMESAGYVRGKAPATVETEGEILIEVSGKGIDGRDYYDSFDMPATLYLVTSRDFQYAWDALDEPDWPEDEPKRFASWSKLPDDKIAGNASLEARWGRTLDASEQKVALKVKKLKKLLEKGGQFGVLSAYGKGSKAQNQAEHGRLTADLQKLGLRPVELKGKWAGVAEKSYLVPNMRFSDLIDLGRKYKQESVIFKSPDGVLGMYYLRENAVEFAVDDAGDMAVDVAVEPKRYKDERERVERGQPGLYSKSRGVSFEFGVLWGQKRPWNGRGPYTRDVVEGLVSRGEVRAR